MEDSVAVSPVLIVLARVSSTLNRKFPELDASQTEMLVTTSPLVPAQFDHAGNVAAMATAPAEAAAHVIAGRVVTDDTLLVPAAPAPPASVCSAGRATALCGENSTCAWCSSRPGWSRDAGAGAGCSWASLQSPKPMRSPM